MFMIAIFLIRKDLNKKKKTESMLHPRVEKMKIGEKNGEYECEKKRGVIRTEVSTGAHENNPKYLYKQNDLSGKDRNGSIDYVHALSVDTEKSCENSRLRAATDGTDMQHRNMRLHIALNGKKNGDCENRRGYAFLGNNGNYQASNRVSVAMHKSERNCVPGREPPRHSRYEKMPVNRFLKPYLGKLEFIAPHRKSFTFTNVKFYDKEKKMHIDKYGRNEPCVKHGSGPPLPNERFGKVNATINSYDRTYHANRSFIIQEAAQALLILKYNHEK